MSEALDAIEGEMSRLRSEMRTAAEDLDGVRLSELRSQLMAAQDEWDELLGAAADLPPAPVAPRPLTSVREQVLHTLALIGAPAAQKTIRAVHSSFFQGAALSAARMASLRRDEERSFHSRASRRTHVCPALHADTLRPARSVLVSSEWPLEQRLLTPGSDQVNYLTMAVNLAAAAGAVDEDHEGGAAINELLTGIALNIPGLSGSRRVNAARIRAAAQRELDRLLPADQQARAQAAKAAAQLDPAEQLFGLPAPQNT